MSLARGEPGYNALAVQLMQGVHSRFVAQAGRPGAHSYWKMSVDLSKPLVPSEGNLDAFDALSVLRLLREAGVEGVPSLLGKEISDWEAIVQRKMYTGGFHSADALDLGEALQTAAWHPAEPWARMLTDTSLRTLEQMWQGGEFDSAARSRWRLGFREMGTAIGVQVCAASREAWRERVEALQRFWRPRLTERDSDITPVMFVTSLLPMALSRAYDGLPPMKAE